MLKEIKIKNEEIIINHLEEVLGKEYDVQCNWGFPITQLEIHFENDEKIIKWKMGIDILNEKYQTNTYSAKKDKDGNEIPDWADTNSEIFDFLMKRITYISAQFFTTKPMEEEDKTEKDVENEIENEKTQ